MLRDDRETETEFVTISWWATIVAMTGGTGADPHHAHHLGRDKELLLELPDEVQILTILESRSGTAD
jgi:heme-degrading monooxygenase HmoA